MSKIDAGEESDDSGVIDLTRNTEFEVGRTDGFIGIIKPGTPGVTVKRKGAFEATASPKRRPMAPVPTDTPPPRKWDSWKPTPAQDYKTDPVKFDDEDKKPSRRKSPSDGPPKLTSSPGFDMAKFLANEQNLAAMPSADHLPQLKTKLLPHQLQVISMFHATAACPPADLNRHFTGWLAWNSHTIHTLARQPG
ncbi:hypothetical protein IMZ48_43460 [Candidatus Bathyarchaeota archaeon]|nr:hypothetical protein [Candidatus Bathyarchaeota archaeon]